MLAWGASPYACLGRAQGRRAAGATTYGSWEYNAMAFIPIPQCAQVQIYGQIDRQVTINDLYFSHGTPIDIPALQSLADAVMTWHTTDILPNLSDDWSLIKAVATDLTTNTSGQYTSVLGAGAGGTSGESNPNNVAATISFRTALRGRSYRGRNYIPGVPGSNVTLNTLDPGWMLAMTNGYGNLIFGGAAIPADWAWVVASRYTGGAPRVSGIVELVTNVLFVDDTVDSMRRRLPGRGR